MQQSSDVKYIVVSGGVCSSLGKGVTASSIGAVLKAYGFRVTALKIDPYLNEDAGLMSPFEHGEVFVLDDGGEADLDLGNYERTMDLHLQRDNNITTGKVFRRVLDRERRGEYLGMTVQMVPHVTDEINAWIRRVASIPTDGSGMPPHVCIIELGGTVGDIESMIFLEALRLLRFTVGKENFCLVHCTLVPITSGQKTKPTQHTCRALSGQGLPPDIIVCRCTEELMEGTRRKIALQCGVPMQAILSVHDVPNLLRVPLLLDSQGIVRLLSAILRLDRVDLASPRRPALSRSLTIRDWEHLSQTKEELKIQSSIAIVGKYTEKDVLGQDYTGDTYISLIKALDHASIHSGRQLRIIWVNSGVLEQPEDSEEFKQGLALLQEADGILIPGGFGDRGIEGKIRAARYARESKKPYLGICLGMQCAVVEMSRTLLGIEGATSEEFRALVEAKGLKPTHVLRFMPEVDKTQMGATMVLGARRVILRPDSLCSKLYGGATEIVERHRHRYEVHEEFHDALTKEGVSFVGKDPKGERMEVVELDESHGHPFFLGTQFHPEYKSRPGCPSPPFLGLMLATKGPSEFRKGLEACVQQGPYRHYLPDFDANAVASGKK